MNPDPEDGSARKREKTRPELSPTEKNTAGRDRRKNPTSLGKNIEENKTAHKTARIAAKERLLERTRYQQSSHPDPTTSDEDDTRVPPSPIPRANHANWSHVTSDGEREADSEVFFTPLALPPNQLALDPSITAPNTLGALNDTIPWPDHIPPLVDPPEQEGNQTTTDMASFIAILDKKLRGLARTSDLDKVIQKTDENAANTNRLALKVEELNKKINNKSLQSDHRIRQIINSVLEEREAAASSSGMSIEENTVSSDHNRRALRLPPVAN